MSASRELDRVLGPPVHVDCSKACEILSAHLDQEADPDEAIEAIAHRTTCTRCSQWWASVGAVTKTLRVRPAELVPDIATTVLAQRCEQRRLLREWIRASLGLLAIVELVFAVSGSVAGASASSIHDTRHLGAFAAAVAGALLFVAWRPARAQGVMPIVVALGFAIPLFAIVDFANGELSTGGGVHHLVQLIGLVLVWALAWRPQPRSSTTVEVPSVEASPSIRLVAARAQR